MIVNLLRVLQTIAKNLNLDTDAIVLLVILLHQMDARAQVE